MRKYEQGPVIRSMPVLLELLDRGQYVYCGHRAYHPGWIASLRLITIWQYLRAGSFRYAYTRQEWLDKQSQPDSSINR